MNLTVQQIINHYRLLPHPEGGYFKETYRAELVLPANALPAAFAGDRQASTAIYFLLEQGNFSAFHRIHSDECWHFYAGQTLIIYIIHPNGKLEEIKLGNDILNKETFQYTVPAGCWFASVPAPATAFSFVGCTVAPGFDFTDFELAEQDALLKNYPQHSRLIKQLTR